MDLGKATNEELFAEFSSRTKEEILSRKDFEDVDPNGIFKETSLILGSVCFYPEGPFVELFKKIENANDLKFLTSYRLRARMNGQRNYKLFYFKSTKFETLKKNLDENEKSFIEWLFSSVSVKMESI